MMGFETITLAPIDLNLVEPSLLTESERAWLNAYHARVLETIAPAGGRRSARLAGKRRDARRARSRPDCDL